MCSNGDQYEGEWVLDKRHGQGLQRYSNGTLYDVRNISLCIVYYIFEHFVARNFNFILHRANGEVMCTMVKVPYLMPLVSPTLVYG